MRILRFVVLLSKSGRYGGPSDTALAQARLAAAEGHQVVVLGGFLKGDQLEPSVDENIRVRSVLVRPLVKQFFFPTLFSVAALRAIVEEVRIADVVHISLSRELLSIVAAWTSVVTRRPVVIQPHGMLTARDSKGLRYINPIIAPLFRIASRSISLTVIERNALMKLFKQDAGRMRVIGNPVIVKVPVAPYERDFQWSAVFIARLHERKRLLDFVRAAEIADSMNWKENYHFAGPDQGELEKVKGRLDAYSSLSYAGALSLQEISSVLSASRTFVMCSANEPWGNVLILALTLGVPCIVTRSTALAEDIENAGAGIVVDDGNPEQIARAVHEVNASAVRWSQLSAGARSLAASRFSNAKVSDALLEVYGEAISQRY